MKKIICFLFLSVLILLTFCKKDSPTTTNDQPLLLDLVATLDFTQSKFIEFAEQSNGDPVKAIYLTEDWLQKQPNVKDAYSIDGDYITIILKSGLKTSFYFNDLNDNGYSIYRGGDRSVESTTVNRVSSELVYDILAKNIIDNKKVLLFEADTKTLALESQIPKTLNILNSSGLGLEITVLRDQECTAEVVETFKDYGLVLIDTHGSRDAFQIGASLKLTAATKSEAEIISTINNQLGNGTVDKLASGKLELAGNVKGNSKKTDWVKSIKAEDQYNTLMLNGKYITALPPMSKTVIFGNMCYSGSTATSFVVPEMKVIYADGTTKIRQSVTVTIEYPIGKAFISRNPISYYGYAHNDPAGSSRTVTDTLAMLSENVLVQRLVKNADSTGIANLRPDNKTEYFEKAKPPTRYYDNLYFRHFGANDYRYEKCGDPFKDERDGHIYKTVCIGKQTWMSENLAYDISGSVCYDSNSDNCKTFGKLYDWNTVMQGADASDANPSNVQGIAPKGWHIPSKAEFTELETFLGGTTVAGSAMKSTTQWDSPNTGATNSSGFSGLPAGWSNHSVGEPFADIGKYAVYWTTSYNSSSNSYYCYWLTKDSGSAKIQTSGKETRMSVRCVKDK